VQLATHRRNEQAARRKYARDYAVAIINEADNPQHVGQRFTVGY
jgi:putative NADH-flavin reductase